MKLPIKHKFFLEIRKGTKKIEMRDAHITFISEKTGERLTKNIEGSSLMPRGATYNKLKDKMSNAQFNRMFTDNFQIWIYLEEGGKYDNGKASDKERTVAKEEAHGKA